MGLLDPVTRPLGRAMIRYLTSDLREFQPAATSDPEKLRAALRPGDVLLVEGSTRVAAVIKYLTQSTWSHSALYIGTHDGQPHRLIEVDIEHGCITVPLEKYELQQTRICRPVGLDEAGCGTIIKFMTDRLGLAYDTRNVIDLARYLFPMPPIPQRFRRRMLALGSGDPTRAICSTLLAQAFESVQYPVLPRVSRAKANTRRRREQRREVLHIRHYSLYAPRDFDLSPYFAIIKPTIEAGFDYRSIIWRRPPKAA